MSTPVSPRTYASFAVIAWAICVTISPAARAATNWNGAYAYERTYRAGNAPVGELYSIKLGARGACRITMTGPSSHEDMVCRAARSDKSVTLHFVKFADANAAAINKARTYQADQRLLTLEKGVSEKRANELRTVWHNLRTMDGKKPKSGVRFKAVRSSG